MFYEHHIFLKQLKLIIRNDIFHMVTMIYSRFVRCNKLEPDFFMYHVYPLRKLLNQLKLCVYYDLIYYDISNL